MNSFERRNKIVDLVNAQGSVMVQDLSNLFGISEVTIRTDLRLVWPEHTDQPFGQFRQVVIDLLP